VNHLAHVEWRWIDGVFLGGKVSRREDEFTVPRDTSIADVVAHYDRARSRAGNRSTCAGFSSTWSKKPPATPATPTQPESSSTAPPATE